MFQEMSECTDEAGKVLKPSTDNPFIESQQPNVVDMRGKTSTTICSAVINLSNILMNKLLI